MKININEISSSFLKIEDIDSYLELVTLVKSKMSNPEWLGDFSKDDYISLLNNGSLIKTYQYNGMLIGAGVLIPSTEKDLSKFLSSDLDYKTVIDYGPQMVHPDYTGNGIQRMIIKDLDLIARSYGYKYALATIHPDNLISINNLLKNDFVLIGDVILKRGPRNIYRKEFQLWLVDFFCYNRQTGGFIWKK